MRSPVAPAARGAALSAAEWRRRWRLRETAPAAGRIILIGRDVAAVVVAQNTRRKVLPCCAKRVKFRTLGGGLTWVVVSLGTTDVLTDAFETAHHGLGYRATSPRVVTSVENVWYTSMVGGCCSRCPVVTRVDDRKPLLDKTKNAPPLTRT